MCRYAPPLFLFDTVCGFITEYLDVGPDILYCTTYIPAMFLCIQSTAAAAAVLCCYTAVVAAAAAVRRRVPHGTFCCWFIESDSSVLFLFKDKLF